MVVLPKHPKMIIFTRKTHGCWVPYFFSQKEALGRIDCSIFFGCENFMIDFICNPTRRYLAFWCLNRANLATQLVCQWLVTQIRLPTLDPLAATWDHLLGRRVFCRDLQYVAICLVWLGQGGCSDWDDPKLGNATTQLICRFMIPLFSFVRKVLRLQYRSSTNGD